jgi:hypothetical protein
VWVQPERVSGLTRFTLLVPSIIKLSAGDQGGGGEAA